ncbi:hypothetical protein [Lysinibacillus sphaericus]|uniref:Uncharacterized protein n=1 Tax=Lysinibacillus sphaericus TaxID=1421 RepID=A0A6H0A1R5_LYSSH|nr:hypothetical protein [Lysinibacillus sphaericus]MBE5085670.1 hypothetical protein [Bacillus thuringiensis]AMO35293.1 hypothetical protein AR327_22645 [Lysinibacillus sphaericus]AMO35463.1 hypothetical protein AR327_23515 [Lysinibacillus sphaericus]AMR93104.1 hypothetical protein A1T07_23140 [Lysinibacillus sphaericus]MBG9710712.1 hypothetical protein [Lysinibacillus sphaericus]
MKNWHLIHFVVPLLWVLVLNLLKDSPPILLGLENKTLLTVVLFLIISWLIYDVIRVREQKVLLKMTVFTATGLICGGLLSKLIISII